MSNQLHNIITPLFVATLYMILLFQPNYHAVNGAYIRTPTYKPVIIVHGINGNSSKMESLRDYIALNHPGTVVFDTNYFPNRLSFVDMWTQVKDLGAFVKNVSNAYPNGFHILGYSQGGVAVRGILQTVENLNVCNFIALSSPLNGQYGDDELQWFPGWAKQNIHFVLYTPLGQKISIGNYWRDPHQLDAYRKRNIFLPVLNNESFYLKPDSVQYKTNFLRIQKLILIGGKDDGVITPYQSAFFGAYDEHEHVIAVENLDIYNNDYFGLKTLKERGSLIVHNISNIAHRFWPRTNSVLDTAVLPYLD